MKHTFPATALLLISLIGLTGCATDTAEPGSADPTGPGESQGQTSPDTETADADKPTEYVMPAGASPASADFPFPIPDGWPELEPFTEGKIGKDLAMSAVFGHPGDAKAASATYQQLLEKAGYQIHPNPLGEQVHAASFITEGHVDGTAYSGTIDFDTDASGTQRVVINLTVD
jgi:hypothetical protein